MFSSFNFTWPSIVTVTLSAISAAAFNLQALAPECTLKFTVVEKWMFVASMPVRTTRAGPVVRLCVLMIV
jgi:hypothetical protein